MGAYHREIESWPCAKRDEWEERAAIMEFDGHMTRAKAEFEAYRAMVNDAAQ